MGKMECVTVDKFEPLKNALVELVGDNYEKIFFAAELTNGVVGTFLMYTIKGKNKRKTKECNERVEDEIEKIWLNDKRKCSDQLWTGVTYFIEGEIAKEELFFYDYDSEDFFDHAEQWKKQYFPGMEFEPDEDEDDWWD